MKRVLFFLGQLNDRDTEWLTLNGHKRDIEEGETLIESGQSIESLYIVLEGEFNVHNDLGDTIAQLSSGEILGEMSFLESRPPSVSVTASSASRVFCIAKFHIEERMKEVPEFRGNFYYALALFLSNRLRKTTAHLGYGDPQEEDLIDHNVLDEVAMAGSRFGQILNRFSTV